MVPQTLHSLHSVVALVSLEFALQGQQCADHLPQVSLSHPEVNGIKFLPNDGTKCMPTIHALRR